MAFIENRISRVDQFYDEQGQPFFPVTHVSCIIGGVDNLDVGTTLQLIDLTSCIMVDHTGTLKIKSFNKIIYTFVIDIKRVDGNKFPLNKTIILARDIPDMVDKVHFKAVGEGNECVKVWLENNYIKAMITPRTDRDYLDYEYDIKRIKASGLVIR